MGDIYKFDVIVVGAGLIGIAIAMTCAQKNKSVYNLHKEKLNNNRFYCFTDGLSESMNDGKEIGVEGSIKILENNYNKELKKQLSDTANEVIKNEANEKLSDDLTIIAIGK